MNVFTLAYQNIKRKRVRSLLTVGGVGTAVFVLISLLGFDAGYQQGLNKDIDKLGYHVLVTAKGCPYEAATLMLKGGGGLRYMEQDVVSGITDDPRVQKATPQLVASLYDENAAGGQGGFALFMGIDRSFMELKPWMEFKSGGWFSGNNADEVIMGYEAAEVEQRKTGDEIYVPRLDKVLKVSGILERTGTQDDGVIFLPLESAQRLFELPGKLTGLGIKLTDINELTQFEEDLYNVPGIQVVSLAQVKGTILNLVAAARAMANSIALIAVFIALIGVTNTILMSVFERTKEIGVLKALGASSFDVFKIIWTETTLICLMGGVFGIIAASAGSHLAELIIRALLPYAPAGPLVLVKPQFLVWSLAAAVVMGFIAGTYPALRAAGMKPVEAIRSGE